jgi:hypothetical protein
MFVITVHLLRKEIQIRTLILRALLKSCSHIRIFHASLKKFPEMRSESDIARRVVLQQQQTNSPEIQSVREET